MFIVSFKMNRKKAIGILIAVICFVFALFFIGNRFSSPAEEVSGSLSKKVTNYAQMVEYLESFGWEVSEEPCEIVEVSIPTEFNDVYESYNALQESQGFDLAAFKGEHVKRFTFEVFNYPEEPEYVRANLLIREDQVIAGDISSVKSDGFMQGLQSIHS